MLTQILLVSVLLTASAPIALAADGTFERTLTFSGALTLSVNSGSGYIHVYPGSDNQLHVIGRVHSQLNWLGGDPDGHVRQIVASPPILQSGNIITIGQDHSDPELFHNISIDYEITAPAQTTLKASTGSGSLEIGGILGAVTAKSGSGSIHVDNVGADSHFETGSGSIRADHVHGAATAQTGSGHIELSVTSPGDVQARTGSGGIQISGVTGGLQASAGSGSIDVSGEPAAEWRVQSGSGSLHFNFSPSAHFSLNASTGSGHVQIDRPVLAQGSLERHHVTGTVNGGGPTVRASTGSGSITIQ